MTFVVTGWLEALSNLPWWEIIVGIDCAETDLFKTNTPKRINSVVINVTKIFFIYLFLLRKCLDSQACFLYDNLRFIAIAVSFYADTVISATHRTHNMCTKGL